MKRLDRIFLFILYAPILPILFFLACWWGSFLFIQNDNVSIFALIGLSIGIFIDGFILKKWLKSGYNLKPVLLIAIYLFYSGGLFGLFMGVPVFNVLPGVLAGIYSARKAILNNWDDNKSREYIKDAAQFSVAILAFICTVSAYIALKDPYTGDNLSGMFGLGFAITEKMIWAIIIIGGLLLLAFQYWIAKYSGLKVLNYSRNKNRCPTND
jgi:hypothetical protein